MRTTSRASATSSAPIRKIRSPARSPAASAGEPCMTLSTSTPACPGGVMPTPTPGQPGPSSATSLAASTGADTALLAAGAGAADVTLAGVLLGDADCPAGEQPHAASPTAMNGG